MSDLTLYHDSTTGLDYADIGETTPVSWQPKGNLNFDEWIAIGNTLQQVNASLNWWIGDWLNYGERQWGEMYAQAVETTGWDYDRLRNAKWVAGKVQLSLRNDNLKWSHHYEVASLEPDEQAVWLNRAEVDGWSVRRLREEIKGPQLPPPALSFAEPSEAPFNHQPRTSVTGNERTAVDEYEQQAEVLAESEDGYNWTPTIETDRSLPHVAHNSGNNEWYTPEDYIEAARLTLGTIELDPATSEEANGTVGATTYYTIDNDGLAQEWRGKVWMNPPYAADLVGKFIDKLILHFQAKEVDEAIVLVNNATETRWFQALASNASAICFPASRIKFWSPNGGTGAPLQGQAILYLGPDTEYFLENFHYFGLLMRVA